MEGLELIVYITADTVCLTPYKYLTYRDVNWCGNEVSVSKSISWKVRVLQYLPEFRVISLEVIDYDNKESYPQHQFRALEALRQFDKIFFCEVDPDTLPVPQKKAVHAPKVRVHHTPVYTPTVITCSDTFQIPIKKAEFEQGYVSCNVKFKQLPSAIEAKIYNDTIRKEFDAVKGYFANALGKKKIEVNVSVELRGNEIMGIAATSNDIEGINEELIENIKFEYLKGFTKKRGDVSSDSNLHNMDELFREISEDKVVAETFYIQDTDVTNGYVRDADLVRDLSKVSDSKHYHHLRYLSHKHDHEIMRLRFIQKPMSFLFLMVGEHKYHIVWETLDTAEATYVWQTEKNTPSLKKKVKEIDAIVGEIKAGGKRVYLDRDEEGFRRIYHDYSETEGGFAKWKQELQANLI